MGKVLKSVHLFNGTKWNEKYHNVGTFQNRKIRWKTNTLNAQIHDLLQLALLGTGTSISGWNKLALCAQMSPLSAKKASSLFSRSTQRQPLPWQTIKISGNMCSYIWCRTYFFFKWYREIFCESTITNKTVLNQ